MAKRRNKNKAKREFAANVKQNGDNVNYKTSIEIENKSDEVKTESEELVNKDKISSSVQLTEIENRKDTSEGLTEKVCNQDNMPDGIYKNGLKTDNVKGVDTKTNRRKVSPQGVHSMEEACIYPHEVDGETCLDIECGGNTALLYMAKLCLGSKGTCIKHLDKWLTPNEFQSVSGRETAKDWKRSIRHHGKSLKTLIAKGLISIKPSSPSSKSPGSANLLSPPKKSPIPTSPKSPIDNPVPTEVTEMKNEVANVTETEPAPTTTTEPTTELPITAPIVKTPKKKPGRKPKKKRGAPKRFVKPMPPMPIKPLTSLESIANSDAESEKSYHSCNDIDSAAIMAVDTTADDRTDDERRLDEFVKTLRLTKTTAQSSTLAVPVIPPLDCEQDKTDKIQCEVDLEMPILQKEPEILVPETHEENPARVQTTVPVTVCDFHTTVTPPPTPPGEQFDHKPTPLDKTADTYTSCLMSPSNGLKLTINRENIKRELVQQHVHDDTKPQVTGKSDNDGSNKQNMQAYLLHDALQSAKRYKEKLQQDKKQSSKQTIVNVPVVKTEMCKTNDSKAYIPAQTLKSTAQEKIVSDTLQKVIETREKVIKQDNIETKKPSNNFENAQYQEVMKQVNGSSMHEMMASMSSLYGTAPFPIDSKDPLSALHALQQKNEMFKLLSQGTSPLLYPMLTQQIMLAMTQQLYSMYQTNPQQQQQQMKELQKLQQLQQQSANLPSQQQHQQQNRRHQSQHHEKQQQKQHQRTNSHQQHRQHVFKPTSGNFQYKQTEHHSNIHQTNTNHATKLPNKRHSLPAYKPSTTNVPYNMFPSDAHAIPNNKHKDLTNKSRKRQAEDTTECVLDLSMKKPKLDIANANYKTYSDIKTNGHDAPLDFSLKNDKHANLFHYKPSRNVANNFKPNVQCAINPYSKGASPSAKRPGCTCWQTPVSDDIKSWTVEQVCSFLTTLEDCVPYIKTFHEQGISGRLLPYLTPQHLTRTLGMKVGPALTLIHALEQRSAISSTTSPSFNTPCLACSS